PRKAVGRPIIGIYVSKDFTLKGSRALYQALTNKVSEATYSSLEKPIKDASIADVRAGTFPFRTDDSQSEAFLQNPKPEGILIKIDFSARLPLKNLQQPSAVVEETQISASTRRCLRVSSGDKLIGDCALMPRDLMAETNMLEFVAYDPSGQ